MPTTDTEYRGPVCWLVHDDNWITVVDSGLPAIYVPHPEYVMEMSPEDARLFLFAEYVGTLVLFLMIIAILGIAFS